MVKAIQGNSESGRLTLWACESIPRRSCKSTESFYLQYKLAFSEEATGYMLDKFCNSLRHFWGRSLLHTKSPSSVRQSRHFIANAHTHACFPGRGRWLGQLEWPLQYFISVFHKQDFRSVKNQPKGWKSRLHEAETNSVVRANNKFECFLIPCQS